MPASRPLPGILDRQVLVPLSWRGCEVRRRDPAHPSAKSSLVLGRPAPWSRVLLKWQIIVRPDVRKMKSAPLLRSLQSTAMCVMGSPDSRLKSLQIQVLKHFGRMLLFFIIESQRIHADPASNFLRLADR